MPDIFISYRRSDCQSEAFALHQSLLLHFNREQIFLDTSRIELGAVWSQQLENAVQDARIMFVLIGPKWLKAQDEESGMRRLDDPKDWVRREVEMGLSRNILIVPLLFNGADFPRVKYLPRTLQPLASFQYLKISTDHMETDFQNILSTIQSKIKAVPKPKSKPYNLTPILLFEEFFLGREKEINNIYQILESERPVVLLTGLGGIGKTAIVKSYIKRYLEKYEFIAWITVMERLDEAICGNSILAKSLSDLGYPDILKLIKKNDIEAALERTFGVLSKIGKTLLVIDSANNYVNLGEKYEQFFRFNANLCILITSRLRPRGWRLDNIVNVDKLPMDRSLELFYKYYTFSKVNKNKLKKVIEKLDNNPLLIQFVAKSGQNNQVYLHKLIDLIVESNGIQEKNTIDILCEFVKNLEQDINKNEGPIVMLSVEEKAALSVFVILPPSKPYKNEFLEKIFRLLNKENFFDFQKNLLYLYEKGWIEKEDNIGGGFAYKIHAIKQRVAFLVLKTKIDFAQPLVQIAQENPEEEQSIFRSDTQRDKDFLDHIRHLFYNPDEIGT